MSIVGRTFKRLLTTDNSNQVGSASTLAARVDRLENELGLQKDIEDVRRLQYAYNYYNSAGLFDELLALVSPNALSIEIGGQGVFEGKSGFVRLFDQFKAGRSGVRTHEFGSVLFQLVSMDIITISPNRLHAQARARVLTPIFRGFPNATPRFNGGDYEMEYVKEGAQWMISKFKYVHVFAATFEKDGTVTPGYSTAPSGAEDGPTTWYHPWPETGVLAFHFPNPITGGFPQDVTGEQHYWIGNWPGEFGKTGHL